MSTRLPRNLSPDYKMGKKKKPEDIIRDGFNEVRQPGLAPMPSKEQPKAPSQPKAPTVNKPKPTGTSSTGKPASTKKPIDRSNTVRNDTRSVSGAIGSATYNRNGQKTGQRTVGSGRPAGINDIKHAEPKTNTGNKPKSYIQLPKKESSYIKLPKKESSYIKLPKKKSSYIKLPKKGG